MQMSLTQILFWHLLIRKSANIFKIVTDRGLFLLCEISFAVIRSYSFEFNFLSRHSSLATSAVGGVGIGAGLCGRARWSCRERISPPLRERILVLGGWHGCPSGCWHPDGALPVDLRDHRLGPGAL